MHRLILSIAKSKQLFLLVLLVISLVIPSNTVFAVDQLFFSQNDVLFYNPEDVGCSDSTDSGSTQLVGDSTGEKAFNFLVAKGLSDSQAAGIVGNLMQESGGGTLNLSVTITNSIGAYGIAQWLGGRKEALMAKSNHNTIEGQLDFLWEELTGKYKNSVLSPIQASSTLEESTRIFLEFYEIPCTPGTAACEKEYTKRLGFASGITGDTSGGASSNSACVNTSADGNNSGDVTIVGDKAFPLAGGKSVVNNPGMFSGGTAQTGGHPYTAYDIMSNEGTVVVSMTDGVVKTVTANDRCAGKSGIIIYNAQSNMTFTYFHSPAVAGLSPGSTVKAGQQIATVGNSARYACSSGSHLHIDAVSGDKRPSCSRLSCTSTAKSMFLDIGPDLYKLYSAIGGN